MNSEACFRAIAYYRLSEKDKEKAISDSIENQRKLIHEYIAREGNIVLVKELYDDGYTGTNYNRPGFCAVMDAVEAGEVDCIIVKDLSRLGREYIETGKYLERIFPALGVRFVAVNDDYDSSNPRQSDDIIVPVKNLMNESYCRDLSVKLRKQFLVQRRNGEYLGAFASYGYCKSPEDKHKLIVDEYAAEIVRGIFYAKMQGYSQQAIANTLNSEGILAPSEYKKQKGLKYKSGFSTSAKPKWTSVAITKILKNPVYIGELVQGKRGTPNFKVKMVVERKPEEWTVVPNCHQAIIEPLVFESVQKMLGRDTRTSPHQKAVHPLGGYLYCADCGRSMVLRSVTSCERKFSYYICSTNKKGEGCTSHSFEKGKLETKVLQAIKMQIQAVVQLDELIASIRVSDLHAARVQKIQTQIDEKLEELQGYAEFKSKLYEALRDELINKNEFTRMQEKYRRLEAECEAVITNLNEKLSALAGDSDMELSWVEQYLKYQDITELSREAVVSLVDKVLVYEDKRILIIFNYKDELAYLEEVAQACLKAVV